MVSYLGQQHARIIQAHIENGVLHLQVSANFNFQTKNMDNIRTFLRWYMSKPVGRTAVEGPDPAMALSCDSSVKFAMETQATAEVDQILSPPIDASAKTGLPQEELNASLDHLLPTTEQTEQSCERPSVTSQPRTKKSKSKKLGQQVKGTDSAQPRKPLGVSVPNVVTRSRKQRET